MENSGAAFNGSGLEMAHVTSIPIPLTRVYLIVKEAGKYSLTATEAGKCSPAQKEDEMAMVKNLWL